MRAAVGLGLGPLIAGTLVAGVDGASTAFPGADGKIAFGRRGTACDRIWTVNPSGGGLRAVSPRSRYLTAAEPA